MANVTYNNEFDDFVSSTLDAYTQNTFADNVFEAIPFFNMMTSGGRYIATDGGNDIREPVMLDSNGTAKAYQPFEDLDVTPSNAGTLSRWEQARYNVNVVISGDEKDRNNGKHQIIDLLRGKMEQAELSIRDLMSTDLFSTNDGTDGKSLIGLRAMIAADPTTTSVGGIATSETSWRNKANTSTITFSTGGEAAMSTMFNDCTQGSRRPDLIVTTQGIFERYETALRADGRLLIPASVGDSGIPALSWKGVPITWDRDCPAGHMFFANTKAMKLRYHSGRNFRLGDPTVPANKDATYWKLLWRGQLTTNERRVLGVLSDLDN